MLQLRRPDRQARPDAADPARAARRPSRERRRVDRRIGRPDTRVFPRERRVGERRGTAEIYPRIADDAILEIVIDVDPDPNPDEITRIRGFAE